MHALILTTVRAGFRSHLIRGLLAFGIAMLLMAYLASQFSPRHPQTVALDVGFSSLRIGLVLLAVFWVQELIAREIDQKSLVFALSFPISRSQLLLSKLFGVLVLLMFSAVVLAMLLWALVLFAGQRYDQEYPVLLGIPFFWTIVGIYIDVAVVTTFTLFIVSVAKTNFLPLMVGMGFAVGAKATGAAQAYIAAGADGDQELVEQIKPILDSIGWILPNLDRLDWRDWPLYGAPQPVAEYVAAVVANGGYLVAALALACLVFEAREFS